MYVTFLCVAMLRKVSNIKKIDLKHLLGAALKNNFFNFEGKISKQIHGTALSSPQGPTFANAFLSFL